MTRKKGRAGPPAIRKQHPAAHLSLLARGRHHQAAGEFKQAVHLYKTILSDRPDDPQALHSLATTALQSGHLVWAELILKRVIGSNRYDAGSHSNLGVACKEQGKVQEAVDAYRAALICSPAHANALSNLAFARREQGLLGEGIRACVRASNVAPGFADALNNLGNLFQEQGRADEAIHAFEAALREKPDFVGAGMNLIFAHLYRPGTTLTEIGALARDWSRANAGRTEDRLTRQARPGDPGRLPRIGLVSADFRAHAVGLLALPALASLVKAGYQVVCYSMNSHDDELTAQFKKISALWRPVRDLGDDELAGVIHGDAIDILVDLSGFSFGNRLLAFARKPAPVQVAWLGCPSTTGMDAMDYILADRYQIPPGAETQYTEAVVRLPHSYTAFAPSSDAPEPGPLPAGVNGWVTFGSFNTVKKISGPVIKAWSAILLGVDKSRLLLKAPGFACDETRQRVISLFAEQGITSDRIDFLGGSTRAAHLAAMRNCDIVLDTFPYCGGQTTLECLWMGLPVISLTGETFANRHSLSYLSSIGLGALAVADVEGYVGLSMKLAQDLPALAALRQGMRARILASPLADSERFGLYLQAALNQMWRRWCAGLKPSSFTIDVAGSRDYDTALELYRVGRLDEADDLLGRILRREPNHADARHCRALIACRDGRFDLAIELVKSAILLDPSSPLFFTTFGYACRGSGRSRLAIGAYHRALRLRPDYAEASNNRGNALREIGNAKEAEAAFRGAVCADPSYVEALVNLSICLNDSDKSESALKAARRALRVSPAAAQAHFTAALALFRLDRVDEAIRSYRAALAIKPDHVETMANLADALRRRDDGNGAAIHYLRAICLRPNLAEAHYNLGNELLRRSRVDEAAAAYHIAICLKPDFAAALYQYTHCLKQNCLWQGFEQNQRHLLKLISHGKGEVAPFFVLTLESSPADQLMAADLWAASQAKGVEPLTPSGKNRTRRKIRLGYLSPDYRNHPVASLAAELFERHDRERFDVFGYSYGPDDGSPMRQRLAEAFDRFNDVATLSDRAAAQAIQRDEIDILIDLAGYTNDARTRILAYRPAPVQVNFLGYPGTMGGAFMDYVIADPICVPSGQDAYFREKLVRLPDCYQPNDTQRSIADAVPVRGQYGLPEDGFVFCCFNNSFKIMPRIFERWMRILREVPGSVLWLIEASEPAQENLRREAANRHVDPARLIFAPKRPLAEHLARYRLADLFLDTLPYNAHTTASDALWAGVPVLTCLGQSFAGRVAASLLSAVNAPQDLIAENLDEYQARAVQLARDSQRLAAIRAQIQANRMTAPLFDIGRFTRNLETAYGHMWDLDVRGLPPERISL